METLLPRQYYIERFLGADFFTKDHLLCTPNFPQNQYFLSPDTHTYENEMLVLQKHLRTYGTERRIPNKNNKVFTSLSLC